ncbi:MAG: glycosyltransferase family 4 protein [Bacteroidetes bacterium]|nr:MAG: glycosyltransferase family 4 protein [Bacteroidota bacterium]
MKILLFSFNFPPNDGGIARMAAELFEVSKDSPCPFHLLTYEKHLPPGATVTIVPKKRIWAEWAAWRKIRNWRDPVLATIWHPEGWLSLLSPARKKIILVHGSELLPHPNPIKNVFIRWLRQYTLRRADVIVANSQYTARLVKQIAAPRKLIVNTPGVNLDKFRPQNREDAKKRWGVAGRFVLSTVAVVQQHKGYETVFKALKQLPESILNNLTYLIAGDGKDKAALQKKALEAGVEKNIRWLGFVPDEDLTGVYAASDLFVLCSTTLEKKRHMEGFGMALLEAQACGIPVVGTRSGGIPDAITTHPQNALIEDGDWDALTRIILQKYHHRQPHPVRPPNLKTWSDYLHILQEVLGEN